MNSDNLHAYIVFDPQGEVKKEELDQAHEHAHRFLPEQFAVEEEIPFILLAKVAWPPLPSHLLRHCRAPLPNEKWLNRKS